MDKDKWNKTWVPYYGFSPQDHRRDMGGFEGEYFDIKGITDKHFSTPEEAIAALRKVRHGSKWIEVATHTFSYAGQRRYLELYESGEYVDD